MSRRQPTPVNIRNFSVKCGNCDAYPVLAAYEPGDEHNLYRFECDELEQAKEGCVPILLEIPVELDEFGNRDPNWHGGKKHAGADGAAEEAAPETEEAPAEAAPSGGLLPVVSS